MMSAAGTHKFDIQSEGMPTPHHKRRSRKSRLCRLLNDKNYKILMRQENNNYSNPTTSAGYNLINIIILLIVTILTVSFPSVHGQPPSPSAGFLDFDNLPLTRFSCEGKVIGGYYADVEAGCQMFHVCTLGQKDEVQDIKFLCLNGTVFDQETRVCERVDEVDCSQAEKFYDLNLNLYVPHVTTPKADDPAHPLPPTTTSTTTTTTTTTSTTTTTQRPTPRTIYSTFVSPTIQQHGSTAAGEKSGNTGNGVNNGNGAGPKGYSAYTYFHRTPHSVISSGYNSQLRQSYLINHQDPANPAMMKENPAMGRKIPSGVKPAVIYTTRSTGQPYSSTSRPTYRGPQAPTPHPQPRDRERDSQSGSEEHAQSQRHSKEYSESGAGVGMAQKAPQQYAQAHAHGHHSSSSAQSLSSSSSEQEDPSGEQRQSHAPNSGASAPSGPSHNLGPYPEEDYYDESAENDYTISSTEAAAAAASPPKVGGVEFRDRTNRESKNKELTLVSVVTPKGQGQINHKNVSEEQQAFYYEDEYPGDVPEADYYDENDHEGSINPNEHHFSHFDVPRIPFAKPNVSRVLVTNGKPFLPRLRRQSYHHQYGVPLPVNQNGDDPFDFYFNSQNSENSESSESRNFPYYSRDERRRRKRRRRR